MWKTGRCFTDTRAAGMISHLFVLWKDKGTILSEVEHISLHWEPFNGAEKPVFRPWKSDLEFSFPTVFDCFSFQIGVPFHFHYFSDSPEVFITVIIFPQMQKKDLG